MTVSRTKMLLGCIADDFTGASDLANVLARGGMRTIQFNDVPNGSVPNCEAGIISLKSRSIAPSEAVRKSLDALAWLQQQGCKQFLFKYCSTFDSTKKGNIGPVADALLDALGARAAIVCPAYPSLKRSIYKGYLFVGDRLLNESGMENHPLNPMVDANLVRWLGYQTVGLVGHIDAAIVHEGALAIRQDIEKLSASGKRLIVCDCVSDDDLLVIGDAVSQMRLVTGGSGVATGLALNFRKRGELSGTMSTEIAPAGPALGLAGSCSTATRQQIQFHAQKAPVLRINVEDILASRVSAENAWTWAHEQPVQKLPLIYSSADPAEVQGAQNKYGMEKIAIAIEAFFSAVARLAVANGVRKLIVAGGETSSAVISALGVNAMRVGTEIDPGVPMLTTERPTLLALALKSGNFGASDFFQKALTVMEASRT